MRSFLIGLQFLTRISIVRQENWTEEDFGKSVRWFPLIGAVLGLCYGTVAACMFLLLPTFGIELPVHVSTALLLLLTILLTGGLFCDGFMDSMDGIFSGRSRDRMLEIMKDSRLGTNGACALLLVFLARYHGLLLLPENLLPLVIVLMPLSARACNPLLMLASYARKEGLGNLFIGKITWGRALVSVGIGALLVFALTANLWLLAAYLLLAVWQRLFTHYITGILGGMTGDTLGAGDELSEIIFLVLCCLGVYHGWL